MTRPPGVALLGPWPPPYGGVAVHLQRLYELLVDDGFAPRVLSFDIRTSRKGLHRLRYGRIGWPVSLATFARVVGWRGILHNHSGLTSYPDRHLPGMLAVSELARVRWVETMHDQTIITRFPRLSVDERRLYVRAMTNAARIITIGDELRDFVVDLGIPASNVLVGHPLLPARENDVPLPEGCAQFFAEHAPVWITIGAFIPLYDFATVARAFRRLVQTEPAAGLVILSGRFAVDEGYEREVRSLLRDLAERVLVLEDVPNAEVAALLRSSTLLIRGPRRESFGLSRAEAILAEIPVVATPTGQTKCTTPYEHGDIDSLLAAARMASGTTRDALREAATYYVELAAQNYEVIRDVYEELGARRELGNGAR